MSSYKPKIKSDLPAPPCFLAKARRQAQVKETVDVTRNYSTNAERINNSLLAVRCWCQLRDTREVGLI